MSKSKERLEARELRRKGESINVIARVLGVSKGTASVWCKDITLTKQQIESLAVRAGNNQLKGRMIGAQMNKEKKLRAVSEEQKLAKIQLGKICARDSLIAGIACYWGEGTKANSSQLGFSNSDPTMIRFMMHWFMDIAHISKERFIPRILINGIHRSRIDTVTNFWSEYLDIPVEQFRTPTFIKTAPKKTYENYDKYYGVLMLRISKSTRIKYRILGLIDALKSECYK